MFHSIRSKLVVAVVIMAALLGTLIYVSSARLGQLGSTLEDLQSLQEFKTHVLAPQKDMNQFIAGIDKTVLLLELGQGPEAQQAYDGTVDAEQDISGEFATLEETGQGELLAGSEEAHLGWETATEFLKIYAEKVAEERGIALARPSVDPTKTVDAHTTQAMEAAQSEYGGLTAAQLKEIADNPELSPVETADDQIDGLQESTDEVLAEERAAGDESLRVTSQTIIFGSIAVLLAIVVIGGLATASVSKPLTMLKQGAERIADGELGYTFENVPDDEVGAVIKSVERMAGALKSRIANLGELTAVVILTADDIEAAANSIEPKGPEVEAVLEKTKTLQDLGAQMLESTKQ